MPHPRPKSALRPPPPTASADPRETVLLAVTGESPAILTETVWALAREQPPVLPARVIVVTTTVGAARIASELLAPSPQFASRSPWQALRNELLAGRSDGDRLLVLEEPRIITGPAGTDGRARKLEDLRTREDNDAAADFILDEVRRVTANPDTRLVASIAGGRKTMGALLYAALTLVGRETDRLTHVLVNAPFDQRLEPPFLFPPKKTVRYTLRGRDGSDSNLSSAAARIALADVPFVPLRNAFEELRQQPGGFAGLVARYSRELRELAEPPTVTFDDARHSALFDGRPVPLENSAQLGILRTLFTLQDELHSMGLDFESFAGIVRAWHGGQANLTDHDQKRAADLAQRIARPAPAGGLPDWVAKVDGHAVTRTLSILRTRLRTVCPYWKVPIRSLVLPHFRLAP